LIPTLREKRLSRRLAEGKLGRKKSGDKHADFGRNHVQYA
jgi:hypothetical protein